MNCLNNYIGLRGCGSTAPSSGLYINDLPGISIKQLVALTNEEEATYIDLWNMIQRRSEQRFSLDVREQMTKSYRIKNLLQSINLGNNIQAPIVNSTSADYLGFTIEMVEDVDYEYVPSPLASIHVQELRYYATEIVFNPTIDIKIFDLFTNEELFSYTLTKQLGWNTIPVNKTFHNNYAVNSWSVYCCYDAANEGSYAPLDIPLYHSTPTCCDVRLRGGINISNNYTYTSDTYGLSGQFSIVCNWDSIVCQNKTIFARAYWYLLGIELITEQLYSNKLNRFTTIDLNRANELRKEYQIEYMKSLEQIAYGFKLDCDCCLECSGAVQVRESNQFY
jgi:hypothetical protein